jgi:hypothetical protein
MIKNLVNDLLLSLEYELNTLFIEKLKREISLPLFDD